MRTKAAVLYEMEKPAPYAESQPLSVEDVELDRPGCGEVLVEIAAAGLCHSDLSVIDGSRPRVMPMVLGHEASGIVREVGPDVTEFNPGDHVVFSYVPVCGRCLLCVSGRASLCEKGGAANVAGTLLSGARRFRTSSGTELNHHLGVSGFSQFTVAAQESLVKIEEDIPLSKAALFGCAVMTGVGAVVNTAMVEPGTSVIVFGMGGVGLSAVMGAKLVGAWPIVAVDILEEKLKLAKQAGATHTLAAGNENLIQVLKDLTGGGAHYTFEAVGSESVLMQAYDSTRRGGQTIIIGLPHPSKKLSMSQGSLVGEERVIKGSYLGSAVPRRDVPRFISLYREGLLPVDLLFSRTIGIEEINSAFDTLARGEVVRQVLQFAL